MDVLASLLHEVRSTGALFCRNLFASPWGVRFADRAALTLLTMVRGEAWIVRDGGTPVSLGPKEVAIVVGPDPFSVTDDPALRTLPRYVVYGPDQCTSGDGGEFEPELSLELRTWGDRLDAPNLLLTGSYPVHGRVSQRLLSALPKVLTVPHQGQPAPIFDLTVAEITRDDPGQQAILDRLLDLLLLSTLREWFNRPDACTPPWYRASSDPVVGPALRLLHDDPARPWSVADLADQVGVSRATLARRFTELLGESPIAYLSSWRLTLATDLLERSDATVDAIARQVGYANGYALSAAFKRHFGTRPSEHRMPAPARFHGNRCTGRDRSPRLDGCAT